MSAKNFLLIRCAISAISILIDIRYLFDYDYHHLHPSSLHRVQCIDWHLSRDAGCGCKLDGTDTRVWPGHSRVTPGRFPSSVLELRHVASLADNWFRARRDEMRRDESPSDKREKEKEVYLLHSAYESRNWKVFTGGTIYRARHFCGLRRKGCTGQPLLRLRHDRSHRRRKAIAVWRIHLVLYPSTESCTKRKLYRVSNADVKKVNCRKIHSFTRK